MSFSDAQKNPVAEIHGDEVIVNVPAVHNAEDVKVSDQHNSDHVSSAQVNHDSGSNLKSADGDIVRHKGKQTKKHVKKHVKNSPGPSQENQKKKRIAKKKVPSGSHQVAHVLGALSAFANNKNLDPIPDFNFGWLFREVRASQIGKTAVDSLIVRSPTKLQAKSRTRDERVKKAPSAFQIGRKPRFDPIEDVENLSYLYVDDTISLWNIVSAPEAAAKFNNRSKKLSERAKTNKQHIARASKRDDHVMRSYRKLLEALHAKRTGSSVATASSWESSKNTAGRNSAPLICGENSMVETMLDDLNCRNPLVGLDLFSSARQEVVPENWTSQNSYSDQNRLISRKDGTLQLIDSFLKESSRIQTSNPLRGPFAGANQEFLSTAGVNASRSAERNLNEKSHNRGTAKETMISWETGMNSPGYNAGAQGKSLAWGDSSQVRDTILDKSSTISYKAGQVRSLSAGGNLLDFIGDELGVYFPVDSQRTYPMFKNPWVWKFKAVDPPPLYLMTGSNSRYS